MKAIIYQIYNKANGKRYIGSSLSEDRLSEHIALLKLNKHHCKTLQNDFKKFGLDGFIFSIIDEVDEEMQFFSEYAWINIFHPKVYNVHRHLHSGKHQLVSKLKREILRYGKEKREEFIKMYPDLFSYRQKMSKGKYKEMRLNRLKKIYP